MRRLIPLLLSLVVFVAELAAADRGTAIAFPISAQTAVRVGAHGELSDETWRAAPPISEFVQREPAEGREPSQRTEFRVAFDASTLYVKVRAFDSEPDKIVGYLTRRDADSPAD